MMSGPEDCLFAKEGPLRPHSNLYRHFGHAVTGVEIIVYCQGL